jgi:hypothetical protein
MSLVTQTRKMLTRSRCFLLLAPEAAAVRECGSDETGDAITTSKQKRQRRVAGPFDFECQELICSRTAQINSGDRDSRARRHLDETETRIHRQRGAVDQHSVSSLQMLRRGVDDVAGNGLAEENDVRLQQPVAVRTGRQDKRREISSLEIGMAVGASAAFRPSQSALSRPRSCCSSSRIIFRPQLMQRTRSSRPWRSITLSLPAA